jgi:hypothetical protein
MVVKGILFGGTSRREGRKEKVLRGEYDKSTYFIYGNSIMKPTKKCLKRKGEKDGAK